MFKLLYLCNKFSITIEGLSKLARKQHIDWLGMLASFLCLIHCWILPFLLLILPGLNVHEEAFHPILGGAAIISAVLFFARKQHRNHTFPLMAAFLFGNALILSTIFLSHDYLKESLELVVTTAGSLCLLIVHFKNYQLHKAHHTQSHKNEKH